MKKLMGAMPIAMAGLIGLVAGTAEAQPAASPRTDAATQRGTSDADVATEVGVDPARLYGPDFEINQLLAWADSDGDDTIDRDEFDAFRADLFDRGDLDEDGRIDRAELIHLVRERREARGYDVPAAMDPGLRAREAADAAERRAEEGPMRGAASLKYNVRQRLQQMDANGDGKIQRDEAPEPLARQFTRLDENKDGALDLKELQQMRRPMGGGGASAENPQLAQRLARQMLKNQDADGDGKISRDEAGPRLKQHFETIDANDDGMIDGGELRRAADMLRGQAESDERAGESGMMDDEMMDDGVMMDGGMGDGGMMGDGMMDQGMMMDEEMMDDGMDDGGMMGDGMMDDGMM